MINVELIGHEYEYEIKNIIKLFFEENEYEFNSDKKSEFKISSSIEFFDMFYHLRTSLYIKDILVEEKVSMLDLGRRSHEEIKKMKRAIFGDIYDLLIKIKEPSSPWGILTGVRPVKVVHEMLDSGIEIDQIKKRLYNEYKVSKDKIDLMVRIAINERPFIVDNSDDVLSLYLCVPFCPSKCNYCSFPSYSIKKVELFNEYVNNLKKEIIETSKYIKTKKVETIYFGGGTPSVLSSHDIKDIFDVIYENFDVSKLKEVTFEAGRPETITDEKLKTLKSLGVDRICINPQTFNDATLKKIGRNHIADDIIKIYEKIRAFDFNSINMDLILGLEGEGLDDLKHTMKEIIRLRPDNITVHTLSVKKGSKLRDSDLQNLESEKNIAQMVDLSREYLIGNGYEPYYLYRQKFMLGNLENVGYSLKGKKGIYNIQIIEERQSIIAFGAGATSKIYNLKEDRFERVANSKDVHFYNSHIDSIIKNKNDIIIREFAL